LRLLDSVESEHHGSLHCGNTAASIERLAGWLRRSRGPRKKRASPEHGMGLCDGLDLYGHPKGVEASDKTLCRLALVEAMVVISAQVHVCDVVAQDKIGRGQHR